MQTAPGGQKTGDELAKGGNLGTESCVLRGTKRDRHFPEDRTHVSLPSHHHPEAESKTDLSNLFQNY